jgi:hypothetical protein
MGRWSSLLASACLYSHNFISALWIFCSLARYAWIYCMFKVYVDTASITLSDCLFCFVVSFYYDIFSYGALSTGFFIPRSSLPLFWYEHFWCLIILIKMLFLERRKNRNCRRCEKHIFLLFLFDIPSSRFCLVAVVFMLATKLNIRKFAFTRRQHNWKLTKQ